jgi:hypothetical protein
MPARRCSKCDKNWTPGRGRLNCPLCGAALSFQSHVAAEDKWPAEPLPPIDPETEQLVAKGWDDLRAEAKRRGVSQADVLELRDDWAA